jgi:hypothetical protein
VTGTLPTTALLVPRFETASSSGYGVAVDASASTGPITSYRWSFGDGATAVGTSAAHTYSGAGTYTVTLTIGSASGATAVATQRVTVPFATSGTAAPGQAGTLDFGSGVDAATVQWSPQSFAQPVTVQVAPAPGIIGTTREHGALTLRLTVTTATGAAVTHFAAPLEFTFPADRHGNVPAYSINGVTWTSMPELAGQTLPAGFKDGWYRDTNGTVHVLTLHATYFGLLASPKDARPELEAMVSAPKTLHATARETKVRVRSTLPATVQISLRSAHLAIHRSAAVSVGAAHVFTLPLPQPLHTARVTITVTVIAGRSHATKVLRERGVTAPHSRT